MPSAALTMFHTGWAGVCTHLALPKEVAQQQQLVMQQQQLFA